jgi:hypothetical protein
MLALRRTYDQLVVGQGSMQALGGLTAERALEAIVLCTLGASSLAASKRRTTTGYATQCTVFMQQPSIAATPRFLPPDLHLCDLGYELFL